MKKMQCEVCGSSEIKKIDDTTFECQSCGVQYDKSEVQKLLVEITGKVKIDHSEEVDNHIKRAEQLEQSGNIAQAKEHYNAALDLDATNESAQDGIKELTQKSEYEKFFVVDSQITNDETVEWLLREMATTDNIVCDIYKEISIKKITNKYNVFALLKGKYKHKWSAIMCYREYEKQTVYKDKYDVNTGKYYKEPTTEKVERINRVPSSGEHVYGFEGLALVNNFLQEYNDLHGKYTVDALISDFEDLQCGKYSTYTVKKLDSNCITEANGKKLYKDIELDFNIDEKIVSSRKKELLEKADEKSVKDIQESWDCDFYENISATRQTLSESVAYVCLPVQIIEYTYKSQDYIAVCDLVSHTTTITKTYPEDCVLVNTQKQMEDDEKKYKKMPDVFLAGLGGLAVGLFYLIKGMFSNESVDVVIGGISALVCLVLMAIGVVLRKRKIATWDEKSQELRNLIFTPRQNFLSNSCKQFFDAYKKISSIPDAVSAVSTDGLVETNEFQPKISYYSKIVTPDEAI